MEDHFRTDGIFRQMLDTIPDLALVKGPKSKIVWGNKAFRDYYGMTNEQLRDLIDSPLVDPDMTQSYIRDDAKVFTTGQVLNIASEPVMRHDGVIRHFHTVKSPIRDSEGHIILTIGISRDIEERQRNEELQQKLTQSEKLAAVGQLAAGVAHEMNNPLGVMLGFAEALKKRAAPEDPEYGPLSAILREGLRCKLLVQELLTFSRRKTVGMQAENPQEMLEHALTAITAKLASKKIRVHRKLAHDSRTVWMDRVQMQQVALHLCANSLDAMPEGGELTVTSRYADHSWIFSVCDTGIGISEAARPRIFEPFFTTKEVGQGTGLGLSTSYKIIQDHKGHILFESAVGQGTTFLVQLPLNRS